MGRRIPTVTWLKCFNFFFFSYYSFQVRKIHSWQLFLFDVARNVRTGEESLSTEGLRFKSLLLLLTSMQQQSWTSL